MSLFRRSTPLPLRRFSIVHREGTVPAAAPAPSVPLLIAEPPRPAPPPASAPAAPSIGTPTVRGMPSESSKGAPVSGPATGPECTNCHLPTLPAGGPERFSCPVCGRSVGRKSAGTPIPPAARTPENPGVRRSQELLAAWITGSPVPCPKCKSPLGRAGPGELRCRRCGEVRRVSDLGTGPALRSGTALEGPSPPAPGVG
jgi:hypothetical protein